MKYAKTVCLLALMLFILINPTEACHYALDGLTQWAARMVPTLFPFMMLSSLMLCCGADRLLGAAFARLCPLLRLSGYGYYAVFIGFLCGFPMGAKITGELYLDRKLSTREAQLLCGFCNHIGPAYFLGIVMPLLQECGYYKRLPFLFGMYGIPLIYGGLLSYLGCPHAADRARNIDDGESGDTDAEHSFSAVFRKACLGNLQSILLLGGYVTFINALRAIPAQLPLSENALAVSAGFLEIVGGIRTIAAAPMPDPVRVFWMMTALSFGGVSCILQAGCFLEKAGLPMSVYLRHKLTLTALCAVYYASILAVI